MPGPPRKRRDPGIHEMVRLMAALRKTAALELGSWITGSRRFAPAGDDTVCVDATLKFSLESIEVSATIPNERTP
jgi:hypothetical protein